LLFNDVIGLPWGSRLKTHLGKTFMMVQPSLKDILENTKRATTIMYPKDIGFILVNMNISNGQSVIEAGTGSGALTTALCWAFGPEGHVYSYETQENFQGLARKNVEKLGLQERVTFKIKDIGSGFDESGIDALFLDLPNPEDYLISVREALRPGGFFGSLVPTTNQVSRLVDSLYANDFAFIEVCEIMLRYYKPVPARLRPDDRMTAHTGFLIFARPISHDPQIKQE
jgi:tRNA (adenine57-N1/adenine58-N1)-methyltransferase